MRRELAVVLALCCGVACRTQDVAPPELRRPIEALPAGAQAVLLASDLDNTWQRVEALQLDSVAEEWPMLAQALDNPKYIALRDAYRALETRTGLHLKDDVLLNVAGGRAGLGFYKPAVDGAGSDADDDVNADTKHHDSDSDLLLVAELRDANRFTTALASLRQETLPPGWSITDATLDGEPALRLHGADTDFLVVQRQNLLAVATRDDLVRDALQLHAGTGQTGALQEPAVQAALAAVGSHNLVMATGAPSDPGKWSAQAFTWNGAGLHFESVCAAPAAAAQDAAPAQRDKILGSVPDGMTLACYMRARDLDLGHLLESLGVGRHSGLHVDANVAQATGSGQGAAFPGMPFLPADVLSWAGDEMAVALLGVEPTALAPIPNVALILEVRDGAAARRSMQDLEARLGELPVGPAAAGFETARYGGKEYRTLVQPLSEKVSPSYYLDDEVAIIATTRDLLHQILDTRRTGRRSVLTDDAFDRFDDFVPQDAQVILFADQKRLHAAAAQLGRSASMWGPKVSHGVEELERVSKLLEHFPAGAAYVTREPDRTALRGWMLEEN